MIAGRLDITVTNTQTTTNLFTDVAFLDQVIVTEASLFDLSTLFRDFPAIVSALQALVPTELPLDGLTSNQRVVAENLNAISQLPGFAGSPLESIFNTLASLGFAQLADGLDQLHPEPYDAWTQATQNLARVFHQGILDRIANARHSGPYIAPAGKNGSRQDLWRMWGHATGSTLDRDRSGSNIGYTATGGGFQAGWDRVVNEDALIGISVLYNHTDINVDTRASGNVDTAMIGAYGSRWWGDFALDASAAFGYHWADVKSKRCLWPRYGYRIAIVVAGLGADLRAAGRIPHHKV